MYTLSGLSPLLVQCREISPWILDIVMTERDYGSKPRGKSMSLRPLCVILTLAISLLVLVIPVMAEIDGSSSVKVIYQTTFSSDPRWETNSPSSDFWDPSTGMYNFTITPGRNNYAYTTMGNMGCPFTFEYDINLNRIDEDAVFRFGLTGAEMDFNKGPNVITMFSNGKHKNIMSLHVVTVGSKQMEVNSQSDDELTSGTIAYKGPSVRFELNKTYHVVASCEGETNMITMRVSDKKTGKEIWSYFIKTIENIRNMNRIYLGSIGDYRSDNIFVSGSIDNVRLTQPGPAITPTQTFVSPETSVSQVPTKSPTTRPAVPTPLPTDSPESPPGAFLAVIALGLIGTCRILWGMK
ncbi:MAG TPA: hypothetical protein P5013_01355 [Methanoregula sp.]|nr:hypothetical protein [Methanoregula sp.]